MINFTLVCGFLKSTLFFISMILWSLIIFPIAILVILFPYKYIQKIPVLWCDGILWLLKIIVGINYKIYGCENIPTKKPYVVVAVHQSAWDTWGMVSVFRNMVTYVMKRELMWIPFLNIALKAYGCIPIKRGDKNMMQKIIFHADKQLKKGRVVGIFPQGTRAKFGAPVNCKSGVWYLYQHFKDVDFIPVYLDSGRFWAKGQFVKTSGTVSVVVHKKLNMPRDISKHDFIVQLEKILSDDKSGN
ncbi:MAG: 1-acyl-sn-glycerol-3-phosphate acyltransferase [Rickettsiales bacterium]|jgi:1-acyl-sn-glycerol-3-phosphate acyltransferase|nr:1-acyl-sn-glycerol-3-phosphate acyltransferase [Rickettsiales bacterium]